MPKKIEDPIVDNRDLNKAADLEAENNVNEIQNDNEIGNNDIIENDNNINL